MRYVPWLKNLILVGALESKGLKVTMENGVLTITKGSMVVIKGVRNNNLYDLKGSTMTCLTSVEEDIIRLWHMRLYHTSEKVLQALVKQDLLKDTKTYKLRLL